MSSELISNTAPSTAPPTATSTTCDPQEQQAPAPAAGVSTLPQVAPSQTATTQTPMQDQNSAQGQSGMQGQNPQLPPLQTNIGFQQPQQPNNLAPPMQQGQQQWYQPPPSPQYQNYSPSQGQPPAPFPQGQGYGQYPYYPPQQQQQQPPYPQQQWQQNPAPYATSAYGYSQPPSPHGQIPQQPGYPPQQSGYPQQPGYPPQQPGYPPQQPAPYYPQYPPTTPGAGGAGSSGLFPKSTNPYIPPTVGYNLSLVELAPHQTYPMDHCNGDVDLIVKAFSSINTDEKILIQVLTSRSHPLEISSRKHAYRQKNQGVSGNAKELIDIVRNKDLNFSGGFKSLTHALVAGPLELDVFLLKEAMKGAGTNERLLDLVLLCRNNEDIKAIAQYYQKDSPRSLWQDLDSDLSGDISTLYQAVMRADRHWDDPAVPIPRDELEGNIKELLAALTGTVTLSTVIKYFIYGSYHRLASINKEWKSIADCKESLEKRIEKKFRGHMEDALRYILTAATDRALCHAKSLDKSLNRMGGVLSNKQEEIAIQVAKIVWEDQLRVGSAKPSGGMYMRGDYLDEVSARYRDEILPAKDRAKKDLLSKLSKETSGHFNDFLIKLWKKR